MHLLAQSSPNLNLLSIGQTGVGKTSFLAGIYTELQPQLTTQSKLEEIFQCIAQSGQPQATTETAQYRFCLTMKNSQEQTEYCFNWWDLPGKDCQLNDPDFQSVVLGSHGACLLIDGAELVNDLTYPQTLQEIIEGAIAIVSLAEQHGMNYPLAIVCTHCDCLEPDQLALEQISQKLDSLLRPLEALKANYRVFPCAIAITKQEDHFEIHSTGAAAPILWLLSELTENCRSTSILPPHLGEKLRQSSAKGRKLWSGNIRSSPTVKKYMLSLAMANISLQALPALEKMVQQEPENLEWQIKLARLYESSNQPQKAETIYDQVLTQQADNFKALLGKAMLRQQQGDEQTAKKLLQQAGKAAPTADLKARIGTIAQNLASAPRLSG